MSTCKDVLPFYQEIGWEHHKFVEKPPEKVVEIREKLLIVLVFVGALGVAIHGQICLFFLTNAMVERLTTCVLESHGRCP